MGKNIINIGTKFGKLTTIELPKIIDKKYSIKCLCECGSENYYQSGVLLNGRTKGCMECRRFKIDIGSIYYDFTIIENNIKIENHNQLHIKLKCNKCNNIELLNKCSYSSKSKKFCSKCKKENLDNDIICITFLKKIKSNATKRNLEFNIDGKYLSEIYLKQNKKCALTGIDIHIISKSIRTQYSNNTASLDRIDSNKGYIKGNVRWVHKSINQLKSDFTDNELLFMCSLLLKNNKDCIIDVNMNEISCAKRRLNSISSIENMRIGNTNKRPIIQYDLNMNYINEFDSINNAVRTLKYKSPSGIICCCKGKQNSCGGYIWKYKN